MTQKEDKERVKTSREELGKFFYRLAEISFTTMVAGTAISLLKEVIDFKIYCIVFYGGLMVTVIFAVIGYRVLNKKI